MKFTSEVIAGLRNQFKYLFDQYGYNTPDHRYILQALDEIEQLQKRIAELEAEIKESNDLLRSAFMIAERDGKETNWEAWHNQLSVALARQHKMMYGKDEK